MPGNLFISNSRVRFCVQLMVFILLLIVADYLVGAGLRWCYFAQTSGRNYRLTYALNDADHDIFIFGSSRARNHFSTKILSNELNMSVYNTGRDGQGPIFAFALLRAILKRHVPKMAIMEVSYADLIERPWKHTTLSVLLPYVAQHRELINIVSLRTGSERLKLLSKTYPFNSLFTFSLYNMFFEEYDENGYIPLHYDFDPENTYGKHDLSGTMRVSPANLAYLKSFLSVSLAADIQTCIVLSPVYKIEDAEIAGAHIVNRLIKKIAQTYGVQLFDYSADERFVGNTALFCDFVHLNYKGADLFSEVFADDLNQTYTMARDA